MGSQQQTLIGKYNLLLVRSSDERDRYKMQWTCTFQWTISRERILESHLVWTIRTLPVRTKVGCKQTYTWGCPLQCPSITYKQGLCIEYNSLFIRAFDQRVTDTMHWNCSLQYEVSCARIFESRLIWTA
jgi:hypothetical protein